MTAPATPAHAHAGYRPDVDGLRAVAVLAVVVFHAFPAALPGGFVGVDIFFVISGFLISSIIFNNLQGDRFSLADFYARRIRRIFPALILVLAACLAAGWLVLLADEYDQLGAHVAGGAGFIANWVLWSENSYFDNAAVTKPLLHLWSLGIEEQFYIFWPLLSWLAWRRRLGFLALTLGLAVASFAANLWTLRHDPVGAFYLPHTRVFELFVGGLLAHLTLSHRAGLAWLDGARAGVSGRQLCATVGAAAIAAGLALIDKDSAFPGWWALLPVLGAALIIAAGPGAWVNRLVLGNRLMVGIGLISYPLYLWHWPLLSFAHLMAGETPPAWIRVVLVAAAFLLSFLTYRFVERRIRFGPRVPFLPLALLGVLAVVGAAGFVVHRQDGVPARLPRLIRELTRYSYDYRQGFREGNCFLKPEQDYPAFRECPIINPRGRRTLLLWGDSHAAQLFPGYEASFGARFRLIQRTASSCPPLPGIDVRKRRHCRNINDQIVRWIERTPPAQVVLATDWVHQDWARLDGTVALLRRNGVDDIDLVGPVPRWKEKLPKQLYRYFLADPLHRVPTRMTFGLDPRFVAVDRELRGFARDQRVRYLSPRAVLCDAEGCLTRLGDRGRDLVAWDYGHLTEAGSRYLVARFAEK